MFKWGVAIVAIFTSVVVGGTLASSHATVPSFHRDDFVQTWFDASNETYFDGRLPKTPVRFKTIEKDKNGNSFMGQADCSYHAKVVCIIDIDPRYNTAEVTTIMTVFHEECHVAVWVDYGPESMGDPEHGKLFEACMINLAKQGAFKKIW